MGWFGKSVKASSTPPSSTAWLAARRQERMELEKAKNVADLDVLSLDGMTDWRTINIAPLVMSTIWSYVAIRTIVNNARTVPITPQVWDQNLKDFVEVGPDDPLYRLVTQPNPYQLWDEFMEATITYLKIFGDVPIHIQRQGASPVGYYPMRPDLTELKSTPSQIIAGWELDRGAARMERFDPNDVIIVKEFSPTHPVRGHAASRAAQQSLLADFHGARYNVVFFQNNTLPSVVLKSEQRMTTTMRRRLRANMRAAFGGSSKAHGMAIMSKGLSIETPGPSHRDMDFERLMKDSMLRTLLAYGVPPGVAGVTENLTNSNLEAQRHIFLVNTLQPIVDGILQKLNKHIFNTIGMRLVANFENVLVSSTTLHERKMERRGYWRDGLITRDEARIDLGYDPIGGAVGAEFYPITASSAAPNPELGSNLEGDNTNINAPATSDLTVPTTDISDDPTGTIKAEALGNRLTQSKTRLPFDYVNVPQNGHMPELPVFKIE